MGITLHYHEVLNIMDNTSVPRKQYLINVNNAVNQGMVHCWGEENGSQNITTIDQYYSRVPIYKNYILSIRMIHHA